MYIEILDMLMGGGKTTTIIDKVNSNPNQKSIILFPTIALCEENAQKITGSKVIYGNGSVKEVIRELKDAQASCLLLTHKSASIVTLIAKIHDSSLMQDYKVYIDELPAPFEMKKIEITHNGFYAPWLVHTDVTDTEVKARDEKGLLNSIHANLNMDISQNHMQLALLLGDKVHKVDSDKGFYLHSPLRSPFYLLPELTAGVTLSGANAWNSPFVKFGQNAYGVQFSQSDLIKHSVSHYGNTSRVTIHTTPMKTQSKNWLIPNVEVIAKATAESIRVINPKSEMFPFAANKDKDGQADFTSSFAQHLSKVGGVHMPFVSHGLNAYRNSSIAVAYGAVRFSAPQRNMLLNFFDKSLVDLAETWGGVEAVAQQLLRCRLRNISDKSSEIHLYVLDHATAGYLKQHYVPDAIVEELSVVLTVPDTYTPVESGQRKASKTLTLLQTCYDALKLAGGKVKQGDVAISSGASLPTVKRYWKELQIA